MIASAAKVAAIALLGTAMCFATVAAGSAPPPSRQGPTHQAGDTMVSFFGFETRVPSSWTRQEPSSSMRLLQMTVPGDAELVVFFFGQGQGGGVEANIERWRSQFTSAEGGLVEPRIERFEVNGMPITVAELTGTYRRNVAGAPATPAPGQTLVAAIIETDRGSLFAQIHGPAAAVAAQRDAFEAFLRGLRPAQR